MFSSRRTNAVQSPIEIKIEHKHVFDVSVNRWDHTTKKLSVSKHLRYKTSIKLLALCADTPCPFGAKEIPQLEDLLLSDQDQKQVKTKKDAELHLSSSSGRPLELFELSKQDHFNTYRNFKNELYSKYTIDVLSSDSASIFSGSSHSVFTLGMATSKSAPVPQHLQATLPPFPPTLFKRKLGLSLTENELRKRTILLDAWMRAVVEHIPTFPPHCQVLCLKFLSDRHVVKPHHSSHAASAPSHSHARALSPSSPSLSRSSSLLPPPPAVTTLPPLPMMADSTPSTPSTPSTRSSPSTRSTPSTRSLGIITSMSSFASKLHSKAAAATGGIKLEPCPESGAESDSSEESVVSALTLESSAAEELGVKKVIADSKSRGCAGLLDDTSELKVLHRGSLPIMVRVRRSGMVAKARGGEKRHVGYCLTLRLRGVQYDASAWREHGGVKTYPDSDHGIDDDEYFFKHGRERGDSGNASISDLGDDFQPVGCKPCMRTLGIVRTGAFHSFRQLYETLEKLGVVVHEPGSQTSGSGTVSSHTPAGAETGTVSFPKTHSALASIGGLSESRLRSRCKQLHHWCHALIHQLPEMPRVSQLTVLEFLGIDMEDPLATTPERSLMYYLLLAQPVPSDAVHTSVEPFIKLLLGQCLDGWLSESDFHAWAIWGAWQAIEARVETAADGATDSSVPLRISLFIRAPANISDSPIFQLAPTAPVLTTLPVFTVLRPISALCDLKVALDTLIEIDTNEAHTGWTSVQAMSTVPFPDISSLLASRSSPQDRVLCVAELGRWMQALAQYYWTFPASTHRLVDGFLFNGKVGGGMPAGDNGGLYRQLLQRSIPGYRWVLLSESAERIAHAEIARVAPVKNARGEDGRNAPPAACCIIA